MKKNNSSGEGRRLLPSLSGRRQGSNGGGPGELPPPGSLLGDMLRSSAPVWVSKLSEGAVRMSADEQKKKLQSAQECALCHDALRSATEPNNKKLCFRCGAVTCRLCSIHCHLVGHIRRRYVCFKCVGLAALSVPGVAPPPPPTPTPTPVPLAPVSASALTITDAQQQQVDDTTWAYISRLWDGLWSGWGETHSGDEGGPDGKASTATDAAGEGQMGHDEEPEEDPELRAQLLAASSGDFNGDLLKQLLEASRSKKTKGDVFALPFTKACSEIVKLMTSLGRTFEFAGTEMGTKLNIMYARSKECAAESGVTDADITVQMLVLREIKAGTTHAGKKANGASRTVLRLLWFLDFVGVLLKKLADEPKADLQGIISASYEETLSPRHVWVLRRIVRGSMSLVPDKKTFIPKLQLQNLTESEQVAKLRSWVEPVDLVRGELWAFMKSKGLEELP